VIAEKNEFVPEVRCRPTFKERPAAKRLFPGCRQWWQAPLLLPLEEGAPIRFFAAAQNIG